MEPLFSTKEVCAIFKISLATLNRRLAAGDFPPPRKIYPHGANRWTKSAIDEVFASMPIADAYKNSTYHESRAHCAQANRKIEKEFYAIRKSSYRNIRLKLNG